MDRSLFWSSGDKIDWSLLRSFLDQRYKETAVLDYKGMNLTGRNRQSDVGEVVKTIAAMANTDGGIILFGIHPDPADKTMPGEPGGVETRDIDSLKDTCRSLLQPAFVPEVIAVPLPEPSAGRYVAVVRIDTRRDPRPVVVRERGVYVRIDDSTRIADLHRLMQLFGEPSARSPRSGGGENFHPSSTLSPASPTDMLVRVALAGAGPETPIIFDSATKRAVLSWLRVSPLSRMKTVPVTQPSREWGLVPPTQAHQLTASCLWAGPARPGKSGEIELVLHAGATPMGSHVVLADFQLRQSPDRHVPLANIFPVDLNSLYEWLMGLTTTVTDQNLLGNLPGGFMQWPSCLHAHIQPGAANNWFDFRGFDQVPNHVGAQYFLHDLSDWDPRDPSRATDSIVKSWLNLFLNQAGCIGHEPKVNAL